MVGKVTLGKNIFDGPFKFLSQKITFTHILNYSECDMMIRGMCIYLRNCIEIRMNK